MLNVQKMGSKREPILNFEIPKSGYWDGDIKKIELNEMRNKAEKLTYQVTVLS